MRRRVVRRRAGRAVVARAYGRVVSISCASSRSSAVSCRTRRAIERSASRLPRSSGSRRVSGRVAARRRSSRAPGQRPQLAAQRLGGRDQQVSQLAESGALGVDRAFACGHKCLQRLAFTAGPRRRRPLLGEHAARGADSVERVGLAARAALPAQPADLEHPLTAAGQEARQTRTEGARPFDSERAPTRSVRVDQPQRLCVAVTGRGHRRSRTRPRR